MIWQTGRPRWPCTKQEAAKRAGVDRKRWWEYEQEGYVRVVEVYEVEDVQRVIQLERDKVLCKRA
jgi:hypothetical protein